jgi:hypothetical protein
LGSLGPGFPLFFEFIKHVSYLMLLLSLVFFAPTEYMIFESYKEYKGKLKNDDSIISLWSFGAFIHYVGEKDYAYLNIEQREKFVFVFAILLISSVVVALLYLIWMRKHLIDVGITVDTETFTPSDFCLMGEGMAFDSYFQDDIENEIRAHFKSKYNIDIVYTNAAYDIKNFYEWTQRLNYLFKMKMLVEGYCESSKISIDKYNQYVEEGQVLEGFPIAPSACPCKKTPIVLEKINEEIESVTAEI